MAVLSVQPRIAVKNVLVATDFSPASNVALQYAIAIARRYGSKIHLVHAIARDKHEPGVPRTGTLWGHTTEAEAAEKLSALAADFPDLECSQWVLQGTEEQVVERLLSFDQVDLVVIGTHVAKGIRRFAIGSAAEHFFRHVHCAVLAVGPSARPCRNEWDPRHLLLTTDLQSSEAPATHCAMLLAGEHEARLTLLHVAPPAPAPFPESQQVVARPYFQSRLKELLAYKPEPDYPVEFLVEFGDDAVAEILRVARERASDLIVLSVHREEPWGFHFVHEAYRIVAEALCPVLITQRDL
ncbi:MAG: universal stress protein [Candidatus Korobacteraceae bacterium]